MTIPTMFSVTCSVAQLDPTLWTLWTIARQAPLSMDSSRQECQSGLPFTSPGDLPNPEIKPASLASPALAGGVFTTAPPGEQAFMVKFLKKKKKRKTIYSHTVSQLFPLSLHLSPLKSSLLPSTPWELLCEDQGPSHRQMGNFESSQIAS